MDNAGTLEGPDCLRRSVNSMKGSVAPKARPHTSLGQRPRKAATAQFERYGRDPSATASRTRARCTSGRAGAGTLAAALCVFVVACGLVFYLFRHDPAATAKANGTAAQTRSSRQTAANAPSLDAPNPTSDASNRERIIPGSNLSPPTVDYSRNPVDAGQRSRGDGSYGSDMSGGGSPSPN